MIIQMRKQFKSTAYKIFLWFVVLAVAGIFSVPVLFRQMGEGMGWAFRVNGSPVSTLEFMHAYNEQREYMWQMRAQYGEWIDQVFAQMDPKQVAFDSLVRKELINQAAHKVPLYVGTQAVVEQLKDQRFVSRELGSLLPLALFDGNGNIRVDLLKSYLRQRGITMDFFDTKVQQAVVQKNFFDMLGAMVYVPEFELKKQYQAEYSNKQYSYAVFSLDNYLKKEKGVALEKDELEKFYQKNQHTYRVPEKRNGLLWEFSPEVYAITISESAITNYYDKNKIKEFVESPTKLEVRRILLAKTSDNDSEIYNKAMAIHEELVSSPEQFESVARRESDDKKTATAGGRMAPFARGQLEDSAFERAAFALQEDGAISPVIKSNEGYEIIQRISKMPQSFKSLASVRQEISKKLAQDRFAKQFTQDIKAIINSSENQGDLIARLASEKGVRARTLTNVVLDGAESSKNLFEIKKKGEATFFVTDELNGVVVQLIDITPAYVPALESIEKTVIEDLYNQKATMALKQDLQGFKEKSEKNQSLDGLGARVEKTGWIGAQETQEVKTLEKQGFPLAAIKKMSKEGSVVTYMHEGKGYLIMLDAIEQFNKADFDEHKKQLKKGLFSQKYRLLSEGLVASLYRNATIETNESLSNIPG